MFILAKAKDRFCKPWSAKIQFFTPYLIKKNFFVYKNIGFDLAKPLLEKAIKINPNYADVYYNLGVTFKGLQEHQKAISCYKKAITIQANY